MPLTNLRSCRLLLLDLHEAEMEEPSFSIFAPSIFKPNQGSMLTAAQMKPMCSDVTYLNIICVKKAPGVKENEKVKHLKMA